MLTSLHIKNVALIDEMSLEFGDKLNVISGETGSGKSIMLNALGFVCGDRLDKSLLRENTDFMRVDAVFQNVNKEVCEKIKCYDIPCDDGEILVSREYRSNGKTICKVNGELLVGSILKKITSYLIDIHGQHEHQSLLDREYQLSILDNFCKNDFGDRFEKLSLHIENVKKIKKQLADLGGSKEQKQNLIDLYSYQINEIEKADIKENELEELSAIFKEMKNSEKISESLNEINSLLNKNSYSLSGLEQINQSKRILISLASFGEKYSELADRLESLEIELNDVNETICEINNGLSYDEDEYRKIDERIDFIKNIFRKYGGDYESLVKYKEDITLKLNNLINSERVFEQLNEELSENLKEIEILQTEISKIRKENATILSDKIQNELRSLGMKNAKFEINFEKIDEEYSKRGFDFIDFLFSANLGFEPKSLSKIASGGELSRFMLAYKIVVNNLDAIDTLIFDEIDTGISGNMANVVANCMGKLSRIKQLIVISHLPQICAMADNNYLVEKVVDDSTHTSVNEIEDDLLYKEIARLMGLMDEKGLNFAKELKLEAEAYKNNI